MKYIKTINNNTVIKSQQHIIIYKNGKQIINPSRDLILEDGWEEYNPTVYVPSEKELINIEKERITNEILTFDSSSEVNIFYIQNIPIWLDKATRAGLKLRFEAEQALNKVNTTLWYEGQQFTLPLETAIQILYALEIYASACYDQTQYHLAQINKLENSEDIKNYNYTTGYPEKLSF